MYGCVYDKYNLNLINNNNNIIIDWENRIRPYRKRRASLYHCILGKLKTIECNKQLHGLHLTVKWKVKTNTSTLKLPFQALLSSKWTSPSHDSALCPLQLEADHTFISSSLQLSVAWPQRCQHAAGHPGTQAGDESAAMLMASFQIKLDRYAICQANPHYAAGQRQKGGSDIPF